MVNPKTTLTIGVVCCLSLSFIACKAKQGNLLQSTQNADSTTVIKPTNSAPYITAYTEYKGGEKLVGDSNVGGEADANQIFGSGEGQHEVAFDSRITIGVSEDDTVGLFGRLQLGEQWLCITFPTYEDRPENELNVQVGVTASYHTDWIGDPFTAVKGVKKSNYTCFDVAFRDCTPSGFTYLEQQAVSDTETQQRINTQLAEAIKTGKAHSYRNTSDTMRLSRLNRFAAEARTLYVATYRSDEGYVFVYLLENDKVHGLDWATSFLSEVHFYRLNGKLYLTHLQDMYAGHFASVVELNPSVANSYQPVFAFSKATD